jgi:hypothetical protein
VGRKLPIYLPGSWLELPLILMFYSDTTHSISDHRMSHSRDKSKTVTSPVRWSHNTLHDVPPSLPPLGSDSPTRHPRWPLLAAQHTRPPPAVGILSVQRSCFVFCLLVVAASLAYRDSYPDTIMTRVKSVPLLPCWTWTVFLIFMFWSGALVCLVLQNHWWLNQIAISPKSLFFGVFSALCFRQ